MSPSLGECGPGRPAPRVCLQICNPVLVDLLSLRVPQGSRQRAQRPGLAALLMHWGLDGQSWGVLCRQVATGVGHVCQLASDWAPSGTHTQPGSSGAGEGPQGHLGQAIPISAVADTASHFTQAVSGKTPGTGASGPCPTLPRASLAIHSGV